MRIITQAEKDQWVAALRSGVYLQGILQLKSSAETPRYCCLGVLCEELGYLSATQGYIASEEMTAGGSMKSYELVPYEIQIQLSTMNDTQRNSFAEIADWIVNHAPVAIDA